MVSHKCNHPMGNASGSISIVPTFLNNNEIKGSVAVGYSDTNLSPMQRAYLSSIYPRHDLKFSWGMAEFGKLYRRGFRRCTECNFMIRIKEYNCPICNRIMKRPIGDKMK